MFGIPSPKERVSQYLMQGEDFVYFVELSNAYVGLTNKWRLFAHEVEKPISLEGVLYILKFSQVNGVLLYRKKGALYAGDGVGFLVGSKEILLMSSSSASCEAVFKYFQNLIQV